MQEKKDNGNTGGQKTNKAVGFSTLETKDIELKKTQEEFKSHQTIAQQGTISQNNDTEMKELKTLRDQADSEDEKWNAGL